jgi:hypothetical protein
MSTIALKIRVHIRAKNDAGTALGLSHSCQEYHRLVAMTRNYVYNIITISSGMFLVALGWQGTLFRNNAALPLASRAANLWNKCLVFSASSCPVCLARAAPNLLICFSASSSQPPCVSTTRGTKARPALLWEPC